PLYVVLLGVFPLMLLLLERHLVLALAVSGTIYLLTLYFGWHPKSYPDNDAWFFNPLAWQFLFVIGAAGRYAPYSRQALPRVGAWLPKLAVGITIALAVVHVTWVIHASYEAFPALLSDQLTPFADDKANLAPLRLLSFLALAVTVTYFVQRNN